MKAIYLALFLVMTACADVKFAKDSNSSDSGANSLSADEGKYGDAGDETGANLNQPPGTQPPTYIPPGTSASMPKVVFLGPPCQRGSTCLAEFRLDRAYAMAVDFDWRTDDMLYQTAPLPGEPINGQPGVHYVSKTGHVTFAAGETVKQITIQNINPYTYAIIIGVRMSRCQYGGAGVLCSELFRR